jgi:hypothetical protein
MLAFFAIVDRDFEYFFILLIPPAPPPHAKMRANQGDEDHRADCF